MNMNEYKSNHFFLEHVVALKRAVVKIGCKLICFSRLLGEKDCLDVG